MSIGFSLSIAPVTIAFPTASRICEFAIIFAKQFSGRRIIEAKTPEPGGESIWSAKG